MILLFIAVLLGFGYTVAGTLQPSNAIEKWAITSTVGFFTFMIIANALSYIIPPPLSFYITIVGMLLCTIHLYTKLREKPSMNLSLGFVAVILLAGAAYARDAGSDAAAMTHLPLASTIAAGNFPVMNAYNPWASLSYHYGPALLAGGTTAITGIPLTVSYALQSFISVAGIVLFAAAIAMKITKSQTAALLGGVLALAGGGWFWLHGIPFSLDLISGTADLKEFVPIIRNMHANPLLMMMGHRPIALGAASLLGLLWCTSKLFDDNKQAPIFILAWLFGAVLALTMETTFVAAVAASLLFVLMMPTHAKTIGLIFIPLLIVAFLQGGILSTQSADTSASAFSIFFDGRIHYTQGDSIALWEWRFIRDYGLPALLLPFILMYAVRQRKKQHVLLLLSIAAAVHFLIPLVVHFTERPHEMNRLFFVGIGLSSLTIGIVLWSRWNTLAKVAIASMLIASVLNLPTRLLFPTLRLEAAPLVPTMPEVTEEQRELYTWVHENSTLDDWFFMRPENAEALYQKDRVRFASHTGRFVIAPVYDAQDAERQEHLASALETCSTDALSELNIRYFVTDTVEQAEWFDVYCDQRRWKLAFEAKEDGWSPRVYELVTQ